MRVAFRVDGSATIGAGHVMRCLALARQLRAHGWQAHFISRAHVGHAGSLITDAGFALQMLPAPDAQQVSQPDESRWLGVDWQRDAAETAGCLAALSPAWLVIDHYGIDARWHRQVAGHVGRVMAIDDLANRPHEAALLLDQNLQATPRRYDSSVPAGCRRLLGPRYALLRPEFAAAARSRAARVGPVRRVLACVGGADPKQVLPRVVDAWQSLGPDRPMLDIAVGADSPGLDALRRLCDSVAGCTLHVQSGRMAELMSEADLLVCGGGSINWERCCVGLPALLVGIAANQDDNLRLLARRRTAVFAGDADELVAPRLTRLLTDLIKRPALLRRMGERSRRLVDGRGARRVAIAMAAHMPGLRVARADDGEQAWTWRNAATTRRYSTDPREISLDEHLAWWRRAIVDAQRSVLVAQAGGVDVGIVRLDHADEAAVISIYLDPELTGLGIGAGVLEHTRLWAAQHLPHVRRLCAVIDARNAASQGAFIAAGYRADGSQWTRDVLPAVE